MANSPSGGEKNKMLPDEQKQLSDAEQRPGVSGVSAPEAPGENSSGVSAEALKSAQVSADSLRAEPSRGSVESGESVPT